MKDKAVMKLPRETKYVLSNVRVFTLGRESDNRFLSDGAVVVEDGKIIEVGFSREVLERYPEWEQVDGEGRVLVPGNVNAHDHLYSAFARGISVPGEAPVNFVQILEKLWWRLDAALTLEDVYYSGLLGCIEAVKTGTTTIIDHHASPNAIDGSLDVLAQACTEVGMRGCFCYEVTDRHGSEGAKAGIQENVRFNARCQKGNNPLLSSCFGLHASFTISRKTLELCIESAWGKDTFFHVHVAEDKADVEDSVAKYGRGVWRRLWEHGLKEFPVLAAHCVHLDGDELDLLAQSDVVVLHNPESNMNNGVGVAPVKEMLARGIAVALGTDGMTQNMFASIRAVPLVHRGVRQDPSALGYDDLYRIALEYSPELASRLFGIKLGVIEVGAAADLVLLDYDPPTPLEAGNFMGHLCFGLMEAPVHSTIINGRFVVSQGKVIGVDESAVRARCRELASKLWSRW